MENVFFRPWVGQDYFNQTNLKRVLILGESHHCGEGCSNCGVVAIPSNCNGFTSNVISIYLNYKKGKGKHNNWMNTFTRFTNIAHGYATNLNQVHTFWHSVIFYNYVQKALSGPRISPTEKEFQQSELAFIEIIEKYKPETIIIWGDRMWKQLPKRNHLSENGNIFYNHNGRKIKLVKIYHPSSSKLTYKHSSILKSHLV